ncbi:hypothetical protein BRD56_03345 [Thermoplasmatales archaeon SW_10_69_26]|nr:MAG: hypothetical protein BRD56_03345 [Thermoplasmatales archaeon SW_10_69_26]
MVSSTLGHRLAGVLTVDVPERPGRFRLVGQLLTLLAVGALLLCLAAAAAFILGFVIVPGIGILGAWAWNPFTPRSVYVPFQEWTTLATRQAFETRTDRTFEPVEP